MNRQTRRQASKYPGSQNVAPMKAAEEQKFLVENPSGFFTVTNRKIVESTEAIGILFTQQLPPQLLAEYTPLYMELARVEQAYQDQRIALCEAYGAKDSATNEYKFTPDGELAFAEKLNELKDTVVEVRAGQINLPSLPFPITPLIHSLLIWLIPIPPKETL